MVLPPEIAFRSAGSIDPDGDIGCLGGYHVQYQIHDSIVNVVILSMQNVDPLPFSEEERWLERLDEVAIYSGNEDCPLSSQRMCHLDQIINEIEEWMEMKSRPMLLQLLASAKTMPGSTNTTIEAFLSPMIINLQLKTVDGEVAIIRRGDVPPWPTDLNLGQPFGLAVKLPIEAEVPRYHPSEVTIVEKHAVPIVIVDNQKLRCKLNMDGDSTLREYGIYRKLSQRHIHELKVPAFIGCVTSGDGSEVVALLMEDIQVRFATLDHAMGTFVGGSSKVSRLDTLEASEPPSSREEEVPPTDRRRKWARQIKEIIGLLHENDIVWGDVKPANVVIDINDDAWAVDFGGGYTLPWKHPADADNMLGDLKALRLIEEYMESGKPP